MSYYDDPKHVEAYIAMSDGYDGRLLIEHLKRFLPHGKTVLELGMGPGRDLDILAEHYQVIGSDSSEAFLDHYRHSQPDATLLTLDASTLDTDIKADAIYSNKVLHLLTPEQLKHSLERQASLLNEDGIILHSFWRGTGEDVTGGFYSAYYQPEALTAMLPPGFTLLECQTYREMDADDSIWIAAKKTRH